jgi:hypothetical protein
MIFPQEIMEQVGISVMESRLLKGVRTKMRERKLIIVVHWQRALKQKDVKQVGRKTRAICKQILPHSVHVLACGETVDVTNRN